MAIFTRAPGDAGNGGKHHAKQAPAPTLVRRMELDAGHSEADSRPSGRSVRRNWAKRKAYASAS